MQGADVLIVFAEVAAAFAGFAGVVVVFGRRDRAWAPNDALRFRFMLENSLFTVAFALLPFLFHHLGASPRLTWGTCSGLLFLMFVRNLLAARRRLP